jgi:hypothetical protein
MSFHTFPLPEDRCVSLLSETFGKRMPEADTKKDLEALHINVQGVMRLRSLADLCGLRVKVMTYRSEKGRSNANPASPLGTRSVIAATHPGVWLAETRNVRDLCHLKASA